MSYKKFMTSFCTNKPSTFGRQRIRWEFLRASMCCSHGPRHYSLINPTILSPSKQALSAVLGSGVMHLCKPSEQYKHNWEKKKEAVFNLIVASRKHAAPCRTMLSPATVGDVDSQCRSSNETPSKMTNPLSKSQFPQRWRSPLKQTELEISGNIYSIWIAAGNGTRVCVFL